MMYRKIMLLAFILSSSVCMHASEKKDEKLSSFAAEIKTMNEVVAAAEKFMAELGTELAVESLVELSTEESRKVKRQRRE